MVVGNNGHRRQFNPAWSPNTHIKKEVAHLRTALAQLNATNNKIKKQIQNRINALTNRLAFTSSKNKFNKIMNTHKRMDKAIGTSVKVGRGASARK
jgi:uncharacterized protein YdcH (DUF465 family)